eukprot:691222-Prorocentrum_lima.AAC.1
MLDLTQHRPRADGLGVSFDSMAAPVALWSARSAPAAPSAQRRSPGPGVAKVAKLADFADIQPRNLPGGTWASLDTSAPHRHALPNGHSG